MLFALVVVAYALFGVESPEREFIIFWAGILMVLKNSATYFGFVFQAMNETKRFSYSAIIERLSYFVLLIVLLVLHVKEFQPYALSFVFASVCQLAYCLWYARDFVSSGFLGWRASARESVTSIRIGINLMIANIASTLIIGSARFIIDRVWGIETFGKLSLALSMVGFFFFLRDPGCYGAFPCP